MIDVPMETSGGVVYVMSVPSGHYKIGVTSQNPQSRLDALQTGNHEKIIFEGATEPNELSIVSARDMEHRVHAILEKTCPRRGEWFKAPESVVCDAYHLAWYRCSLERDEKPHPINPNATCLVCEAHRIANLERVRRFREKSKPNEEEVARRTSSDTSTYRYRDKEKHREYMKDYMRKWRGK